MALQYHLKIDDGDVAPFVLLPGDPGRVPIVASFWDEAHEVARNREYVTYTGTYKGVPISCTSTGIGAPSTAIAVEELARVGAKGFLRIGTCGTFRHDVALGDIGIFDAAERFDGASRLYAPIEFPAAAHHEVVAAAIEAARRTELTAHVGTTHSTDLFYVPRAGSTVGGVIQSNWAQWYEDVARRGVLAVEMEASVIFVLARQWGLRAGAIAVITDSMVEEMATDGGDWDPQASFVYGPEQIERLARMGSEVAVVLAERDAARAG